MLSPQTRTAQTRVYMLVPDATGNIPLQEITDLVALARRAYHRDAQQLASAPDWLKFRVGAQTAVDGRVVTTLEAFYEVEVTEDIGTEIPDPDQMVLPFIPPMDLPAEVPTEVSTAPMVPTPIRRSFPTPY